MRKICLITSIVVLLSFLLAVPAAAAGSSYQWHTFFGTSGDDRPYAITTDSADCSIIVGRSMTSWNGPGGESPLHAHPSSGSNFSIFVMKLDADGSYLWHTFYGGTGYDYAYGVAVDSSDSIYVSGSSSSPWNGPTGQSPVMSGNDGSDAFVLKLNSSGAYQWHSFFGSTAGGDEAHAISLDDSNNVYLGVMSNGEWGASGTNSHQGGKDITVVKLNSTGNYQWHSFFGSTSDDDTNSLVYYDQYVYISGTSKADWQYGEFSPLHAYSGSNDMVVIKVAASSGDWQWHTFYGSADSDGADGIAVDSSGVYACGYSGATWNGPSSNAPLNAYAGSTDLTLLKLNSNGVYQWHTFYGTSTGADYGRGIALDSDSNSCIVGRSPGSWTAGGTSPVHAYNSDDDVLLVSLDSAGAYLWHSFYGSPVQDRGHAIAIDSSDTVYAIGYGLAGWNGDDDASPLHIHTGDSSRDGFEIVLEEESEPGLVQGAGGEVSGLGASVYQIPLMLAGLALFACGGYLTTRRLFGR